MDANEVNRILFVLLSQYNVSFDMQTVGNSAVFEVPRFGVKIIYLDGQEFDKKILEGWHIAWVHPDYSTSKAREKIIWALVKGGYFHYLRHNYKKTFQRTLAFEGWDKSLIEERMRRYKDMPKYNYMREINDDAKHESPTYVLSIDPGFYDFIVE
jgi:hypothetical protein